MKILPQRRWQGSSQRGFKRWLLLALGVFGLFCLNLALMAGYSPMVLLGQSRRGRNHEKRIDPSLDRTSWASLENRLEARAKQLLKETLDGAKMVEADPIPVETMSFVQSQLNRKWTTAHSNAIRHPSAHQQGEGEAAEAKVDISHGGKARIKDSRESVDLPFESGSNSTLDRAKGILAKYKQTSKEMPGMNSRKPKRKKVSNTGKLNKQKISDDGSDEESLNELQLEANGVNRTARKMRIMGSTSRTDKVAFLFLTRGRLPFERTWTKFFNQDGLGRYSIFVHAPASYRYSENSIWHGRKIPAHSLRDVTWGEPSMVEAEKALLQYALQDPGIAKFALVSESDIPVQNFDCAHKMMTEKKRSFVKSVVTQERMPPKMKNIIHPRMWRRGSQWFVLNREHAELVVDDRDFWMWFRRFCTVYSLTPCIADENYIPTLLALRKAEGSIFRHSLTWTQWIDGRPSPDMFGKGTPIKTKVLDIRRCHYSGPNHSKRVLYAPGLKERCGEKLAEEYFTGLGNAMDAGASEIRRPCYVFARKFAPDLAAKISAGFEAAVA